MVESVVLMVSVGLMLDPLTHVAHAFTEARGTPAERLASAMTSIGISVLSGGLTTAAACLPLLFTTIVLFASFGVLLLALTLICLVYAHLFLAPLLFLAGGPSMPTIAPRGSAEPEIRAAKKARDIERAVAVLRKMVSIC